MTGKRRVVKKATRRIKPPAELKVEYMTLSELEHWPSNPKKHDLEGIKRSIRRFGFTMPVAIDEKTRRLVAGHGRQEALSQMKEAGEGPPLHISTRNGEWLIPVVRGNHFKSEEEAERYLIADNRFVELGGWDDGLLVEYLERFDCSDDLEIVGFDDAQLAKLLRATGATQDSPAEERTDDDLDVVADPPTKPKSKAGKTYNLGPHQIVCEDCIEALRKVDDCSIDSIVTDPPYGIGFMGKEWDCSVPGSEFAKEAFRVLKPGGHVVAFGATRTIHRLVCFMEDEGFEVRDQIGWLQWQGFPKNLDISKAIDAHLGAERTEVVGHKESGLDRGSGSTVLFQGAGRDQTGLIPVTAPATPKASEWQGWGTALKPSFEPAALLRKPLIGTVAENVLMHGTGGINVDACRLSDGDRAWPGPQGVPSWEGEQGWREAYVGGTVGTLDAWRPGSGRWPANIYYCPKPSRGEKESGLKESQAGSYQFREDGSLDGKVTIPHRNIHPTVKPVRLMRWLVRLVTPPNGRIVDPFLGSGSTMVAAHLEGMICLGIERSPSYVDLCRARVKSILE